MMEKQVGMGSKGNVQATGNQQIHNFFKCTDQSKMVEIVSSRLANVICDTKSDDTIQYVRVGEK